MFWESLLLWIYFRVSLRMIFSQQWIPKPQFWYPPLRFASQLRIPKPLFFLVFWVYTAGFGFSARAQISPKVPVTKVRLSGPAPYNNPTVRMDLLAGVLCSAETPTTSQKTSDFFVYQERAPPGATEAP